MHLPFCLSVFPLIQNSSWHIKLMRIPQKNMMLFFHFSVFSPRLSGPAKVHDYLQANTTNRSTVNIYKLKYLLISWGQNHKKKTLRKYSHTY